MRSMAASASSERSRAGTRAPSSRRATRFREIELGLLFGGDRRDRGGQRTTVAIRRGRDHADAVVVRARREQWSTPEGVAERVRDRDRARWAGLLAHEAALALEDARL